VRGAGGGGGDGGGGGAGGWEARAGGGGLGGEHARGGRPPLPEPRSGARRLGGEPARGGRPPLPEPLPGARRLGGEENNSFGPGDPGLRTPSGFPAAPRGSARLRSADLMNGDQLVPALAIAGLRLAYRVRGVDREAIRGVTFTIGRGESYGLVGESGGGKATVAYAATRSLPRNGRITAGSVVLDGHNLLGMGEEELRGLRATKVSMVYQNPGTALNPTIRIGDQMAESFIAAGMPKSEATA